MKTCSFGVGGTCRNCCKNENGTIIGRIERIPLREVWKHEALDFTTWLEGNVEVLTEVVDVNLSNVEREKKAGTFNVDLVAEDDNGNAVIIENQLEKSDHDHLGKLLTYLVAMEAKTAIWIVSDPRPEHVNAINWLNESSVADFYLIKAEAIKIGDSVPAPLLTLIVGPSEEAKQIGDAKKDIAERYKVREDFWTKLLSYAGTQTNLHGNISPSQHNWIGTGVGMSGLTLNYAVTQHQTTVELYIDRGKGCDEENLTIFNGLLKNKDAIEQTFGNTLRWEDLPNRRACRISYAITTGGWRDEEKWDAVCKDAVAAMIALEKALRPYIKKLKA